MNLADLRHLPEFPRLAGGLEVVETAEGPALHSPGLHATLGPDGPLLVELVLPRLDGATPLPRIVEALVDQIDPESLVGVLAMLADNGLLAEGDAPETPVTGLRFYRALRGAEVGWTLAAENAERRGAIETLDEESFRRVWRGWWAEELHFAAAAAMKFALAASRFAEHRPMLVHFFLEEHDHILIFRRAAASLGLDPDAVLHAPPLPETAALNAFLLAGVKEHPLCLAWVADRVERGVQRLRRPDGSPSPFLALLQARLGGDSSFVGAYLEHLELEEGAEHGSYGRQMFELCSTLSAAEQHRLLDWGATLERFVARKNRAVQDRYLTEELPRAGWPIRAGETAADLAARAASGVLASIRDPLGQLRSEDCTRLSQGWSHVLRTWAVSALVSPSTAHDPDLRFRLVRLAAALAARSDRLEGLDREPPPSIGARALALLVAEGAETDSLLALGQVPLLEAVSSALVESTGRLASELAGALPAGSFATPANALEAIAEAGPCALSSARRLAVHLQVLGELVQSFVRER